MKFDNTLSTKIPKKNMIGGTTGFINAQTIIATAPLQTFFLASFVPSQSDYITIKGEYEIELVASMNNRDITFLVPVKPNTQYKPTCDTNADVHLFYYDSSRTTKLGQYYNSVSTNGYGTTPANCYYIGFTLTNRGLGAGTYYFKNWQLEEGITATPFEPYEGINKVSKGVGKKNLVPNWNDSGWFQDATALGGTMEVDPVDPYKMKLTITAGAQGRLIWIPVETGKTYTLSLGRATGLYRAYMNKVRFHDDGKWLNKSTNGSITFTTDNNYGGYVTLRFTAGSAGYYNFENIQLEEGSVATSFEPYKEVAKKSILVPKKNYLLPFTEWTPDNPIHVSVNILEQTERRLVAELNNTSAYAGVSMPIDVKTFESIKGKTAILSVNKFVKSQSNSQIQLRFYGGASGNTDFVLGANYTASKVIPTDFTGVFLRVQSNQTGYTKIEIEDLQLEIGDRPTGYNLFELGNKQSRKYVSKKNLIQPFSRWNMATNVFNVNSDYSITGTFVSGVIKSADITVDVEVGKIYTLSGDIAPSNGRIRVGRKSDNGLIGVVLGDNKVTFTATESQYLISIDNNFGSPVYGGTLTFENIQLEEGVNETEFKPYEEISKNVAMSNKISYKKLPFTFQRESIDIFNGLQYGYNQPRIEKDGILIEEGTKNIFSNNGKNDLSVMGGQQVVMTGDRLREDTSTNLLHRATRNITGVAGKQYTYSVTLKASGRRYAYFNADAFMGAKATIDLETGEFIVGKGSASVVNLGDGWYRLSIIGVAGTSTSMTTYLQLNNSFVATDTTYTGDGVSGIYAKDFQLEEKTYATSYVPTERKSEYVYVPDADKYIDTTKGSIEYTIIPMIDSNIYPPSGSWGWNDLIYYDESSNGFLIRRCNEAVGGHALWVQGIEKTYALDYKAGDELKYKLEWDNSGCRLYVNDNMVASTGTKFSTPANSTGKRLYIGSRSTASRKQGNALYKDIIIKDRDGKVTFSI
jgi:hypothetical protein